VISFRQRSSSAQVALGILVLALVVLLLGSAAGLASPARAASPAWELEIASRPTNFVPGTTAVAPGSAAGKAYPQYTIVATNIGGAPISGPATITATLPAGITPSPAYVPVISNSLQGSTLLPCAVSGQTITCTYSGQLTPNLWIRAVVPVDVATATASSVTATASVAGGGAPGVSTDTTTRVDGSLPSFEFLDGGAGLNGTFTASDGSPVSQAGSHPYQFSLSAGFPTVVNGESVSSPEPLRDFDVSLSPGVVVNPDATPVRCAEGELESESGCPAASQVGVVSVTTFQASGVQPNVSPLFNMVPPPGVPAQFGSNALGDGIYVHLDGGVDPAGNYALTSSTSDIVARDLNPILGVKAQLWGDPSDPAHEGARGTCIHNGEPTGTDCSVARSTTPLLTMPSACSGPLTFGASADSWEHPGTFISRDAQTEDLPSGEPVAVEGCGRLGFGPSITLQPDTDNADSPSGLDVDLQLPQEEGIGNLATATLKKAVVTLPAGVSLNPSAADGLAACSEAQIGLVSKSPPRFDGAEPSCPESSKVGTAEIVTPLLPEPLNGSLYVATQGANPFGSLLAGYLVVQGQGVLIKLAGRFDLDPVTGQITATFDENPQLPFSDLKLHIKGGARAPLTTPQGCGRFTARTTFEPWSAPEAPDVDVASSFDIGAGAGGSACPAGESQQPNRPAFEAGTVNPTAGAYSPFVLKLSRENGSQRIGSIDTTLPKGLVAKLAGVPYCSDAQLAQAESRTSPGQGALEKSSPSCPAASEIGTVNVGAGSGAPLYVRGQAYLAGPYKGAPLSLAIVTPAVAGPFDLGVVVVRSALYVDPETAQVRAVSDPIPAIRAGIPLDVRSISLELNKSRFTLNPTSCAPTSILGTAISTLGQSAALSSPFQVGSCASLGFAPKLKISLKGATKRTGLPALKAVVTYPKGGAYANIARAQVNLPHSEFLEQNNLDKTCTRPVLLEGKCSKRTIYGRAKAWTPLLDKPLEGPVYLVGGYGYKLPALVAELNGQIRVLLKGKTDSGPNKGIRNTFEAVPDAPVSRFELKLKGGKKYGLLINSENLCREPQHAIARFTAQNGLVDQTKPLVQNQCGKKGKGNKKGSPR
jgi:hypothetical protein